MHAAMSREVIMAACDLLERYQSCENMASSATTRQLTPTNTRPLRDVKKAGTCQTRTQGVYNRGRSPAVKDRRIGSRGTVSRHSVSRSSRDRSSCARFSCAASRVSNSANGVQAFDLIGKQVKDLSDKTKLTKVKMNRLSDDLDAMETSLVEIDKKMEALYPEVVAPVAKKRPRCSSLDRSPTPISQVLASFPFDPTRKSIKMPATSKRVPSCSRSGRSTSPHVIKKPSINTSRQISHLATISISPSNRNNKLTGKKQTQPAKQVITRPPHPPPCKAVTATRTTSPHTHPARKLSPQHKRPVDNNPALQHRTLPRVRESSIRASTKTLDNLKKMLKTSSFCEAMDTAIQGASKENVPRSFKEIVLAEYKLSKDKQDVQVESKQAVEVASDETAVETAQYVAQEVTRDVVQEVANDVTNGDVVQEVIEDIVQEAIKDEVQEDIKDVVQKATEDVVQEVCKDVVQEVTEEMVQKATEDVSQEATSKANEGTVGDTPKHNIQDTSAEIDTAENKPAGDGKVESPNATDQIKSTLSKSSESTGTSENFASFTSASTLPPVTSQLSVLWVSPVVSKIGHVNPAGGVLSNSTLRVTKTLDSAEKPLLTSSAAGEDPIKLPLSSIKRTREALKPPGKKVSTSRSSKPTEVIASESVKQSGSAKPLTKERHTSKRSYDKTEEQSKLKMKNVVSDDTKTVLKSVRNRPNTESISSTRSRRSHPNDGKSSTPIRHPRLKTSTRQPIPANRRVESAEKKLPAPDNLSTAAESNPAQTRTKDKVDSHTRSTALEKIMLKKPSNTSNISRTSTTTKTVTVTVKRSTTSAVSRRSASNASQRVTAVLKPSTTSTVSRRSTTLNPTTTRTSTSATSQTVKGSSAEKRWRI